MDRTVMNELVAWKNDGHRKPLLLSGARQTGKTWLLKQFGHDHFERVFYVSLDKLATAAAVFDGDLEPQRLLDGLAVAAREEPVDPRSTLIVLDEIQDVPRALASLKYFAEDAPEYAVACAGSLLGVSLHSGMTFPVGKVTMVDVHPMTFLEYLTALGEDGVAGLLERHDFSLLAAFHLRLTELLRTYFIVGGMPEAVADYSERRDFGRVRAIQDDILAAYDRDFSKHAPADQVPRLREIFRSVPQQLARENRKFVYGQVREGARARNYETALQWLYDAGLLLRVDRVTVPRLPLAHYRDERSFKLFLLDVGLLAAMSRLEPQIILEGSAIFTEFKGALTEQYVCQELTMTPLAPPMYWSSDTGTAEVDFVVQTPTGVVPVEVKAEQNLRAKSLRVYRNRFSPPVAVRTSMAPHEEQPGLLSLPLYAIATLPGVITINASSQTPE